MNTTKRSMYSICFFLLYTASCFAIGKKEHPAPTRYETAYNEVMGLKADPKKAAIVNTITLKRDAGIFTLYEGTLYLCQPIENKIRACVFTGRGTFTFNTPNDIERGQIQRTFETDSLKVDFRSLLLFFADSTLDELNATMKFHEGIIAADVPGFIKAALKYQGDTDGKNADFFLMKSFLEDVPTGMFYAIINTTSNDDLAFLINPYDDEEVSLLRRAETSYLYHAMETISQFPMKKRNAGMMRQKNSFVGERYILNCTIADNLDFSGRATIVFRSQQNNHNWLLFDLYSKIGIDSVLCADGSHVPFFKGEKNPLLWVQWRSPLVQGKKDTIIIYYRGDIIENDRGVVYVNPTLNWFPYCYTKEESRRKKAFYDLTFNYPSEYTLVTVGKCLEETRGEDYTASHWVTDKSIRNASFYLGKYKEYRLAEDSLPPVTVLMSSLAEYNMEKDVAFDVSNSIRFFQSIIGRCPVDSLYAIDIPYAHGSAFPAIIHLSSLTFQHGNDVANETSFRSHEVAHQWWGIGVDFESYHDQWLSEGFSDYASLWYTQLALKNNEKFFTILDRYKQNLLQARKYFLGNGQQMGPISLGFRNETSTTSGDYERIVYEKAAWVLHMLRIMMLDIKTMDEQRFIHLFKNFYATYHGSKATTEDFQQMVSTAMGEDMSWFFKQWVFGTEIPSYKFDYDVAKTDEGKFKVHCKVERSNVRDNFKMPVLFLVKFADNQQIRLRILLQDAVNEFDLPLLPLEPEKIIFNDLQSVLCDVD